MTVTSWSLELLTGVITLINAFIFAHDGSLEIATQVLVAIHIFLYFVVIPGSYLLSTDVYRNLIFDQGWYIVVPFQKDRRQAAPEPINELQVNSNRNDLSKDETKPNDTVTQETIDEKKVEAPIPTISGNVNLETSYKVY